MQVASRPVNENPAPLARDESVVHPAVDRPHCSVLGDVLSLVVALPAIRRDRTDSARARIHREGLPSADDLAERVIGQLVCDRLR